MIVPSASLASRIGRMNLFAWLGGNLSGIASNTLNLMRIDREIKAKRRALLGEGKFGSLDYFKPDNTHPQNRPSPSDALTTLQKEKTKKFLTIVKQTLDLPVIFHFMGFKAITSSQAGLLGTVTSFINLY